MMNLTILLLKTIGFPFIEGKVKIKKDVIKKELYDYSFMNHIALLYLDVLRVNDQLDGLEKENEILRNRYEETLKAVTRVAEVLNSKDHAYTVMKTLKPFLATPNDTDILYMGTDKDYHAAVDLLKQKGYHFLNMAPMQAEFYDPTSKEIRGDKKGGIYHIDLYREAAADYIIYLDKYKLKPYMTVTDVLGTKVKVFKPEAELAITLMHGVFPEQSYQLQDFYSVLHFLDQMDNAAIGRFVEIVRSNHITIAISASISITALLHRLAFGNVPEKLKRVLNAVGEDQSEIKEFERQDLVTPYKYRFMTFLEAFLERALDKRGLQSFLVQGLHMLNPLFFKDVLRVVWKKQKEGTYHQV